MGIRIDGASDLINATDGSLTIEGQSINSTGVGTFSGGVKVGSAATIHSTGQFNIGVAATVFPNGNATFAGIVTASQLSVGTAVTIGKTNGNATFAGIVTATSFVGDGSGLTGAGPALTGSTNNTVVTVTGSNAIAGETNFTFDGQTATINGTSNDTPLVVDTTNSNGAHMRFRTNGSSQHFVGSGGGISLGDNEDLSFRAYDNLLFATGNSSTERARINSSGNLGIGTAAPGNLLHTYSASSDGIQFQSPSGQHFIYAIQSNDNLANGSLAGELGIRGKNGVAISGNNGTACQVHVNSNGLCLGGTGAANAMDDYEEGDYTAHFSVEGESNMSMSGRVGKYIKVGHVVTVMGGGTVASVSNQTTGKAIQFTNLPFAAVDTAVGTAGHPFAVNMVNMDSTGLGNMVGDQPYTFKGRLFDNGTAGRINACRADSDQNPQNASLALATNTDIQYMFSYICA